MKAFLGTIVILFTSGFAIASNEVFDPTALYQCRSDAETSNIEVSLHRRLRGIGPQKFVGVIRTLDSDGTPIQKVSRLNLTNIYESRIVSFTGSDLRVRFDRVKVTEGKMPTFMQIPSMKIYADNWSCKGPSFAELPSLD